VFKRVLASEQVAEISGQLKRGGVVKLSGVWGSSAPLLGAAVGTRADSPVLFVCNHLDQADALLEDVEVLGGQPSELFPAWEFGPADAGPIPAAGDHLSDEITGERLRLCGLLAGDGRLADEPVRFLVAPIAALMQPVPLPEVLAASRFSLRKGAELDREKLTGWLLDADFDRVDAVDQQGEFALRGGILDVFAPGSSAPVRIEFFGDAIESIRRFDLDSQRSTGQIDGYDLVATSAGKQTDPDKTTHLLDYLPAETIVFLIEPFEVASLAETFYRRLESPAGMLKPETVFQAMGRLSMVETYAFGPTGRAEADRAIDLGIRSIQRLEVPRPERPRPSESSPGDTAQALDQLEALSQDNEVWVYCENPAERDRFLDLLKPTHARLARNARTGIGHVHRGFHWPSQRLVVVGHHEIFHRYARPRRLRRIRAGRPIDSFVDLEEGDYVVHVAHGIAKYEGLRTLSKDGRKEEFLSLRFADSAVLHVPVTQIQLVQKYVGAGRGHPSLSRLGGTGWSLRKQRVARAVQDLASDLLRVQAIRASSPGVSYSGHSDWGRQFEAEFIYAETEDQLLAMQQIRADMAEPRPMDRLLCGDVGYGKTELAMRAAFRVIEAGRQVAVLVPTTVLAAQHYRTFSERFADYPVVIEAISRFRSKAEQSDIVARAAAGKIDVLIGTHRLLSEDVSFADLGLVVIDEEQRFGVEHKERLKQMRATVEVLTLTATPIPRTLHMALMGLRDISNLTTPPLDRRAIYTDVRMPNDERLRDGILRELNRGGQVFFVHNRVFDIESVAAHVRAVVPEARVEIAHGQMPEHQLEDTMLRFVRGDIDVLVCTTIIESGLDIPNVNTMFIDEADRFGLAQLHQLRGRIGRYKYRAFCHLLLPRSRTVTRAAAKRLKAVEEFSDLGAGFQIAMRDLEIRGAGNILGPEQSGHIAAVGYELYCRMLEQAVHRLKGEEAPVAPEVHVELALEAYVPRSYISSPRQRMEFYRRLASCRTPEELSQLEQDLADAYGPIPQVVDFLLAVAEIRIRAGRFGFRRIVLMPPDVVFTLTDPALADKALSGLAGTVRLADERTAHWRPPPAYLERPTLLTVLRRQLQRAADRL